MTWASIEARIRSCRQTLWGGGLAIARLSDLVRRPSGEGEGEKKEPSLSFARMDSLLGQPVKAEGEEPTQAAAGPHPGDFPYQRAQQEVARILDAAGKGEACNVGSLRTVVTGMVQALATGNELLMQAQEAGDIRVDLPRHMVNVAIFAMKIGQGMGCRDD